MTTNGILRPLLSGALWRQHQQALDGATWVCAAAAATAATPVAGWWPSQLAAAGACAHQHQQQRHKHTVKVVLLQDHPKLGAAGEVVSVKAGYARHSLYPSRIADYAVPGVLRKMREQGLLRGEGEQPARGAPRSAAAQGLLTGGGAAAGGDKAAQELSQILHVLSTQKVVTRRRYQRKTEEQGMINSVGRRTIAAAVRDQLHIHLPWDVIMLDGPITEYGEFKVPLNLAAPDGQQVELELEVIKTRRM
ncbi:hypothetical protein MNEG_2816 [Monoraphidium neglectum]|uniref:Large ribosomal subunit protein bL9c n=1 Tax=Monoraphidium neglectum TaxID=145388 RepID=A0A0D2LEP7_9CHLO|nr:hypothetical protein MNEG_2816 [Monoraphidium neglectum]KIZ05144.1 hypothetical protein MNEG_2816 [Monoraphidium neglectum]|eukprot:XP_013904163.1 hypothetical protein MNEG_2816 [Monoraphidium neglectum]